VYATEPAPPAALAAAKAAAAAAAAVPPRPAAATLGLPGVAPPAAVPAAAAAAAVGGAAAPPAVVGTAGAAAAAAAAVPLISPVKGKVKVEGAPNSGSTSDSSGGSSPTTTKSSPPSPPARAVLPTLGQQLAQINSKINDRGKGRGPGSAGKSGVPRGGVVGRRGIAKGAKAKGGGFGGASMRFGGGGHIEFKRLLDGEVGGGHGFGAPGSPPGTRSEAARLMTPGDAGVDGDARRQLFMRQLTSLSPLVNGSPDLHSLFAEVAPDGPGDAESDDPLGLLYLAPGTIHPSSSSRLAARAAAAERATAAPPEPSALLHPEGLPAQPPPVKMEASASSSEATVATAAPVPNPPPLERASTQQLEQSAVDQLQTISVLCSEAFDDMGLDGADPTADGATTTADGVTA